MIVKSYLKNYEVEFCTDFGFLSYVSELENRFFIIDKKVYGLYEEKLKPVISDSPYYMLDAVETNKNIEQVLKVIDQMVDLKSRRNTNLISIGGGIVQDVSGFAANILYRGVSWTWIPTTLLAQADSCIGSKTSLNYKHYKNLLGYFYPPDRIYVNTEFVHTLEQNDYLSGLGEMMKCALMGGYECYLKTVRNIEDLLMRKDEILINEIMKALEFKKRVIEVDEFDQGYRNIMNYGHTFGHALESTSDYAVPHGQAVSFGMLMANEISAARGYISRYLKEEVKRSIGAIVNKELLKPEYLEWNKYLGALKKDKKYTGNLHNCILWNGNEVKKYDDVTDDEIACACNFLFI